MAGTATDSGTRRSAGGVLHWDGMPADVAHGLEARLDELAARGTLLKAPDERGVVVRIEPLWPGGPPLVLKRYCARRLAHRATHALGPTHAARSRTMARRLWRAGIATPPVLATGESRTGPFPGASWFLAEWVEARTLGQVLADPTLDPAREARLAEAIRRAFARLAALRLRHRDVKLANFLVREPEDELVLIDLDGMRGPYPAAVFAWIGRRDVRRFLANFPEDSPRRCAFAALLAPATHPGS